MLPQNKDESAPRDATEERLLETAGNVFAETGFQAAKVRDICARAKVNLAAVNYHFGDKLGLYKEVLRHAALVGGTAAAFDPALWRPRPESTLRNWVHTLLGQMYGKGEPTWPLRLITHELAQPTPALDGVVDQIIRPRHDAACALVGGILGRSADDHVTRLCTYSVIGQVILYAHGREVLKRLWPDLKFSPENLREIADHIAAFSFAAVKSFARRTRKQTTAAAATRANLAPPHKVGTPQTPRGARRPIVRGSSQVRRGAVSRAAQTGKEPVNKGGGGRPVLRSFVEARLRPVRRGKRAK